MKLKTCFADVLMFIVAKPKKKLMKISKILLISFFLRFLQCTLLGAALDNQVEERFLFIDIL